MQSVGNMGIRFLGRVMPSNRASRRVAESNGGILLGVDHGIASYKLNTD
jgi:RimJ/RimL family protein N-acetyltransferase